MAEKDLLEKTLEEHNDVFADIVNALGFGGRMLVEPESLKPGPTASIYEDLGGQKREQHRDVVKYCTRSGVVLALFGLENQSGEDYDMVFRMMSYDGAAYKQQKGGRKKYPVISFVLYYGLEHWKAPQSLREAIVWPDEKTADASGWQRIIGLVPDYRINLVEVAFLPQAVRERFTSDFRIVAEYFHAKRTGTEAEFVAGPEGHRNIRLVNAQGEDVVAGIRTPQEITIEGSRRWAERAGVDEATRKAQYPSMEETFPGIYAELNAIQHKLEQHYHDMQDLSLIHI